MKAHTSNFKNSISQFGKQIDSIIKYGEIELGSEELNSITPTFQSDLLKSTMKELIIDSNVEIPINTIVNYKFGVKIKDDEVVDYRDNYEYIDFGNYIVQEVNKKEDTNSYEIKCYDFMLRSMTEYHELEIGTFPMTVRQYITNLCNQLSLEFANENEMFVNDDKIINEDVYKGIGYTYRDIFDDLAEVTGSTIVINKDDKVEIRYLNETNDEIDEEYLKDVNVNFGEKYGPINSIVLSRSGESDNVFKQNSKSVKENGLCELKIIDNQIMNFQNRGTYLDELLSQLDGTEYYINDFSSFGICYYDICDKYNIKIGDNTYSCVMFNDEINVTQGLGENIHTDMPTTSETEYKYESEIEKKVNQTYIIVDKQNQQIKSVVDTIGDRGEKETTITQDLDSISSQVKSVPTITTENGGTGRLDFENIKAGKIVTLKVHPTDKDILGLFATPLLKASRGLKALSRKVYFDGDEDFSYMIPCNLYFYGDVYDEFVYDGIKEKIYVNHKIGINDEGEKYVLDATVREDFDYYDFNIGSGNYKVFMSTYPTAYIYFKAMIDNDYTNIFATKVELSSSINQTAEEIEIKVDKKVDEDDIMSIINARADEIDIYSNNVVIESDGYSLKNGLFRVQDKGTNNGGDLTIKPVDLETISYEWEDTMHYVWGNAIQIKGRPTFGFFNLEGNVNTFYIPSLQSDDINTKTIKNSGKISSSNTVTSNLYFQTGKGSDLTIYGTFSNLSQEEYKKNFEKLENALNIVNNIDIYKYNLKSEEDGTKKHIGLVIGENYNYSQEVTNKENNGVELYSMISVCLQAIKEQQKEIDYLKNAINDLKKEMK